MPTLNVVSIGLSGFQWYISDLSSNWNSANYAEAAIGPSPVTNGQTTPPTTIWSSVYPPTPPGSGTSTPWTLAGGFTSGQTYMVYGVVKTPPNPTYPNGRWYNAGSYAVTMQFSWTNAKSSGGSFNLTAAEWNALTSNINGVRAANGYGSYGFTTAYSGDNFQAFYFNQAVNAITPMSPSILPPSTVTSGDTIYASSLNLLVASINSKSR